MTEDERLLALLKRIEFLGEPGTCDCVWWKTACPGCGAEQGDTHAASCEIDAQIKRLEGQDG